MRGGRRGRDRHHARTDGHADHRRSPHHGRGGEARDGIAADDDDAGAEETDSRHDLRGDARRIERDVAAVHVAEAVLADDHRDRCAHTDERDGADARGLVPEFALEPDRRREQQGDQDAADEHGIRHERFSGLRRLLVAGVVPAAGGAQTVCEISRRAIAYSRVTAGTLRTMTRVLVLADTHIRSDRRRELPRAVVEAARAADAILHAGDVTAGHVLDELADYAPVYAVRGNNDRDLDLPATVEADFDGVNV